MGTRCLTIIEDEQGKELVTLYRQYDGYPEGHGAELKDFLKDFKIINGITDREAVKTANGAGCFAAQLVTHFKSQPNHRLGGIYIYPPGTRDVGEEYIYRVRVYGPDRQQKGHVVLTVIENGVESTI